MRFDLPRQHPPAKLLVHYPLVQRVLIDDGQTVTRLHHEIAVVDLHDAGRSEW